MTSDSDCIATWPFFPSQLNVAEESEVGGVNVRGDGDTEGLQQE